MRNIVKFFLILLYWPSDSALASYCYPDFCQNLTHLIPIAGFQCLLTRVQRGEECVKLQFKGSNRVPPEEDTAKFSLLAYVHNFGALQGKATAFNLSVSDINFHRLITRYQNLLDENLSACRHIELYGNQTHPAPTELYVSCPFHDRTYESSPYRLEYLVTGKNYEYSKEYIFTVTSHKAIGDNIKVNEYAPFVYVDVSNAPTLSVYIQPAPEKYNVTEYKLYSINNDTGFVIFVETLPVEGKRHIQYSFTLFGGVYYFKVATVHPDCGKDGCTNSTTPVISIKETSHRVLIMIISTVWIPPVIIYVLYHLYKLYRRRALKRARKPNCLLVYSPTRLTHINVMTDLAKYLRACNINAMIDMLDITDANKDPAAWYDAAFRNADIILAATSPPAKESAEPTIYRDVDNHLFRLLKENSTQKEKRYYTVQFPYCKPEDAPEEARNFQQFCLLKDLPKLVKAIHNVEDVKHVLGSDKELLDSIKLAKLEVFEEDVSSAKDVEETDGLLTTGVIEATKNKQKDHREFGKPLTTETAEGNSIPQSFTTNIDELNLLGESGESERPMIVYKPTTSDRSFRIDELNL